MEIEYEMCRGFHCWICAWHGDMFVRGLVLESVFLLRSGRLLEAGYVRGFDWLPGRLWVNLCAYVYDLSFIEFPPDNLVSLIVLGPGNIHSGLLLEKFCMVAR